MNLFINFEKLAKYPCDCSRKYFMLISVTKDWNLLAWLKFDEPNFQSDWNYVWRKLHDSSLSKWLKQSKLYILNKQLVPITQVYEAFLLTRKSFDFSKWYGQWIDLVVYRFPSHFVHLSLTVQVRHVSTLPLK